MYVSPDCALTIERVSQSYEGVVTPNSLGPEFVEYLLFVNKENQHAVGLALFMSQKGVSERSSNKHSKVGATSGPGGRRRIE